MAKKDGRKTPFTPDKGFDGGATYRKSDTGKGKWKPINVVAGPYTGNTGSGVGSDNDPAGPVVIVEPFMPDTPKRPGSGIGGRHPNHTPDPAPNTTRDSAGDAHPNAWMGPASVPSEKIPETPNETWKGSYGGYGPDKLGDLSDDVTGAGDPNNIIDTSQTPNITHVT